MNEEIEMNVAPKQMPLNEVAVRIAVKLIKLSEGCELRSYPDPASDLSKALSQRNLLRLYKAGKVELPEDLEDVSGSPWTAMYGETQGIKADMVFTQQEADERLEKRVRQFMTEAINVTPNLANYSAEKIAAITSLIYNIGKTNYAKYDISKQVQAGNHAIVAAKFRQYVYAGGVINEGLKNRREREAALYSSVGS